MDQINTLKIGVFYNYDEKWIAGSNYIINFLLAISSNNLSEKVLIKIICEPEHRIHIEALRLTNVKFYECNTQSHFTIWERLVNKFYRLISKKNLLQGEKKINQLEADFVFPVQQGMSAYKEMISPHTTPIFWIPDFQDKYFPDFFSSEELKEREMFYQSICDSCSPIVFSSYACLNDFRKFYPDSKNPTLVYRFRSENISQGNINENVIEKYNLPNKFIFCPNQFWKHKNQKIVLEALQLLKNNNSEIFIVFSGKESDYRNPHYFTEIKDYIDLHNLTNLKLLGFISEEDKKSLFHYAHAIVQPSLFEGWSTLVEEAKTLGKHIVLSDIPVHREQIEQNCVFFNPRSSEALASALIKAWETKNFDVNSIKQTANDIPLIVSQLIEINNSNVEKS
jgi:glycosyltransferase involved in cell wall biosynthesis